jgi:hypothetical protein
MITTALALCVLAPMGMASRANAAAASNWYWSPGWCKSILHSSGVQYGDGRTFGVEQAFCIGKGGLSTCSWSAGYNFREYNRFLVFARSYDGAVRMFNLRPNARRGFVGSNTRILGKMGLGAFYNYTSRVAADTARIGHALGCSPP